MAERTTRPRRPRASSGRWASAARRGRLRHRFRACARALRPHRARRDGPAADNGELQVIDVREASEQTEMAAGALPCPTGSPRPISPRSTRSGRPRSSATPAALAALGLLLARRGFTHVRPVLDEGMGAWARARPWPRPPPTTPPSRARRSGRRASFSTSSATPLASERLAASDTCRASVACAPVASVGASPRSVTPRAHDRLDHPAPRIRADDVHEPHRAIGRVGRAGGWRPGRRRRGPRRPPPVRCAERGTPPPRARRARAGCSRRDRGVGLHRNHRRSTGPPRARSRRGSAARRRAPRCAPTRACCRGAPRTAEERVEVVHHQIDVDAARAALGRSSSRSRPAGREPLGTCCAAAGRARSTRRCAAARRTPARSAARGRRPAACPRAPPLR